MSWMDSLLPILGKIGGVAAAPATGGASLGFGQIAGLMGAQTGMGLLGDALGGGGQDQQPRTPYTGEASPQNTLIREIESILSLGRGLTEKLSQPVSLRSSYVQPGPKPVSIAGLPFQIGGGLGIDPANFDKSLLSMPGLNGLMDGNNPMSPTNAPKPVDPNHPTARPRTPWGAPDGPPGDNPTGGGNSPGGQIPLSPARRRAPGR